MEQFTAPFVNMNGNSRTDLENQLGDIWKAFNPLIESICKTDYDNGRNATDREHHLKMRAEKTEIISQLQEMQEKFLTLYKSINPE